MALLRALYSLHTIQPIVLLGLHIVHSTRQPIALLEFYIVHGTRQPIVLLGFYTTNVKS